MTTSVMLAAEHPHAKSRTEDEDDYDLIGIQEKEHAPAALLCVKRTECGDNMRQSHF